MIKNKAPVSETTDVKSKAKFCAFVFLTFAGYIGLDVLTPNCFEDPFPAIFLMILLVGQLTLICVWGTLVEGTFWIRLPWTILLLVISWAALCCGVYIDEGQVSPAEVMGMGLVWFYGFAISYIPIKMAAWAFGWRITLTSNQETTRESGRYAIRDIMLGTAILAVTLSIGRQLVPGEAPQWSDVVRTSGLNNSMSLMAFFLFSVISLIVKLPCIWIALAVERSKVFFQSTIWIFCSGVLGLIELFILMAMAGGQGMQTGQFLMSLVAGHAVMALSMIVVLLGLRSFGYRLSRKKKSSFAALTES